MGGPRQKGFFMSSMRGPLLYSNPDHPFNNLPLALVDRVGAKGNGGLYYEFFDFDTFPAGTLTDGSTINWEISESNSGAASILDVNATGARGVLRLQCDTNAGDFINITMLSHAFRYEVGKRLWFAVRCRLEDVDQDAMLAGLTAPIANLDFINTAIVDGIYFHKAGTDTDLDVEVAKDSTASDHTNRGGTLVDNQWMVLGFFMNRLGSVYTFYGQNGAALTINETALTLTNAPDDENLSITLAVETADGGGDYMDIDWVFAAQER